MAIAAALEAVIRYLALVALSDYLDQGAFEPKVNAKIEEKIGRPMVLGSWLEVLREVVRAFVTHKKTPKLAGLVGLCSVRLDNFKPTAFLENAEQLVTWRNSVVHPKEVPDLAGEIDHRQTQLMQMIDAIAFLADFELAVPLETVRGAPKTIAARLVCMGDRREFPVDNKCRIEIPEELLTSVILEESPLLLNASGEKVLMVLHPLCLFDFEPVQEIYNYLQSNWRSNRVYSITFGANQPEVPSLTFRYGESPARDQLLTTFYHRIAAALEGKSAIESSIGMRSFEMPSVESEKSYHLQTFVGRIGVEGMLKHWMDRHEQGYVFYEAASGSGKSAYASFLMNCNSWPGHLVKRENQRDRPERFLQYLVWQLMERHGLQDQIPTDLGALSERLFNVLHGISLRLQRSGKASEVIVLDGINELAPTTNIEFLPATLPPRTFIILLSQPCAFLESMEQRVMVDKVHFDLPGLSDQEIHNLLDLAEVGLTENDRLQLIVSARGWPLYLKRVIDTVKSGGNWTEVPITLDGLYDQVIERACKSGDAELVARVLGVLWASREPLSIQDLAAIIGGPPRMVRTVLDPVRPYLLTVNRLHTLYHETFRDYLERQFFNAAQCREFHEDIVQWCTQR